MQCPPCLGNVDEEEYLEMINKVIKFLSGRKDDLINIIEEKNDKCI